MIESIGLIAIALGRHIFISGIYAVAELPGAIRSTLAPYRRSYSVARITTGYHHRLDHSH
ncbi:hypothetical protein PILCRDRAFT_825557 [Piloderma croceum F 1598]|uniref:Uncharacterized protein n=1 Tax=Piloderma croceum (strain F 1598) TaxID=765440 RepID=A0A0C3ATG1_PILCF|nr:hypothetical protein PILCRDRAFT_825557 [Piloderma croceum F 1598]